jgi:hypothetical protein
MRVGAMEGDGEFISDLVILYSQGLMNSRTVGVHPPAGAILVKGRVGLPYLALLPQQFCQAPDQRGGIAVVPVGVPPCGR